MNFERSLLMLSRQMKLFAAVPFDLLEPLVCFLLGVVATKALAGLMRDDAPLAVFLNYLALLKRCVF